MGRGAMRRGTRLSICTTKAHKQKRKQAESKRSESKQPANAFDFVAQAPSGHLLKSATGSFPTVTGVKSEKSVGVPAFGDGGILGPNEYTLQVNTNFYNNSAACTRLLGLLRLGNSM